MDWDFSSWTRRQQRAQAAPAPTPAPAGAPALPQLDQVLQAQEGTGPQQAAPPMIAGNRALPPDQRRLPMVNTDTHRMSANDPRLADFIDQDAALLANTWAFNGGHPRRTPSPVQREQAAMQYLPADAVPSRAALAAAPAAAPVAGSPMAGLQGDYAEQAAAGAPRGSGRPRAYTPADFADDTEGMTYRQLRFAAGLLPPPHHPTGRDQLATQALRIHQANLAGAQQRGQQPLEEAMQRYLDWYLRATQPNGFLLGQGLGQE